MKLSKAQEKVITLMQNRYELTTSGVAWGNQFINRTILYQKNKKRFDNEVRGNIATIRALIRFGLIIQTTNNPMDGFNKYELTVKGKEWIVEQK